MNLAILWHFHQPVYRRPGGFAFVLPWVNYHATKNYYQMARVVEESGFRCTFNFVPCLVEQILDYAEGRALDPFQLSLELPPDRLGPYEIGRLRKFVSVPEDRVSVLQRLALESFFSPVDGADHGHDALLARQKEIRRDLIPTWRRLFHERKTELTVSPYYHPLLPMIFDANAAGEEKPGVAFCHPEDGRSQIVRARDYFRRTFGTDPQGMWPSEGGLSAEAARTIAEAGFGFAVTDENLLWKSLGRYDRPKLFRPHRVQGLTVFFRDRELSDLIGFVYHKGWNERDAVRDFLGHLKERRTACGDDGIVVLALDGENPWGSYPGNGVPFLRELFQALHHEPGITPVFFGEYLVGHQPADDVALVPGTWLGGFSKWSGSPAKNEGWAVLSKARELCGPNEAVSIAEGSDWFWWFGEPDTAEFTFLFESYIRDAYREAGIKYE
jgi:alpha-amylase/alpha-mannosidase (GH57 family)